ncbi:phosphatidate cytidylyltransferase [Pseudosulfitobacter koreensis]|uniref:Phosphatidate cytidylyltransferase n=1 Tax=Pseudosulfitobacter koreensis TaxID=2968472 RepID=A0ABT1Z2C9_9RHOB|nr:phosphatidate cytidylyltransferase [Pseudosulfitobacter koreense]MCR8827295.1 phosphatidate cytidylyltransferase [Pseudosulfitobacter koreense]
MNTSDTKWSDLAVRMGSASVMIIVGLAGVAIGGHPFNVLVALICGLCVWELVRMLAPRAPAVALQLALLSGVALLVSAYLPAGWALPILLAPMMVGFGQLSQHRTIFMSYAVLVQLAGFGIMQLRDELGFGWMLWLVVVVVVTDVVGYFAGRLIGGPKFWPRVSPKKTWSGTAAGWIGAGVVGWITAILTGATSEMIGISIAISMASQMGDIAESAIKRHTGVKDSSTLIPGHGGMLDRFDGMMGASVFLLIVGQIIGFPPGLV